MEIFIVIQCVDITQVVSAFLTEGIEAYIAIYLVYPCRGEIQDPPLVPSQFERYQWELLSPLTPSEHGMYSMTP